MTDERLLLGMVRSVWETPSGRTRASLEPIYEADLDGAHWATRFTVTEARFQFPNEGLVSWIDPPLDASQGTVWEFRLEEQFSYDETNPRHDRYMASGNPLPPLEVLNIERMAVGDGVRVLLTEIGLELPFVPSTNVLLRIDDETWIGPVSLVARDHRWFVDGEQPLYCVASPAPQETVQLLLRRYRTFVVPAARNPQRVGQVDWASDEALLRRVLRSLRKLDPDYAEHLQLTRRTIDHIVELFAQGTLDSQSHILEAQRVARARGLLSSLEHDERLLSDLRAELFEMPTVKAQIEEAKAQARSDAEEELRTRLAAATSELARLQAQIAAARDELQQVEEEAAKRREEVESQADRLRSALDVKLSEIMASPEKALADVAVFRAALGVGARSSKTDRPASVDQETRSRQGRGQWWPPGWDALGNQQTVVVDDLREVRRALRGALRARAISSSIGVPLHAAFLCGAMPLLVGGGGLEILEAYGDCVAGGRLLWIPISPTMVDVSSLLGQVDVQTRRFSPSTSGLLDLLLQASTTDDIYLVVLDGVNRSPAEAYLSPLLACYSQGWRKASARALPVVHPSSVDPADPYSSAQWLQWPPNVLLAAVLTQGSMTMPLPSEILGSTVLLHSHESTPWAETSTVITPDDTLVDATPRARSEVKLDTWDMWRQGLAEADLSPWDETLAQAGGPVGSLYETLALRFYAAERLWGNNQQDALRDSAAFCLAPWFAAQGDDRIDVLSSAGLDEEEAERSIRLAKRFLA